MRQYIMYAVAIADSDQEALSMAQTNTEVHSDTMSHPSATTQSTGTLSAAASASPTAFTSAAETAPAYNAEAKPASKQNPAVASQHEQPSTSNTDSPAVSSQNEPELKSANIDQQPGQLMTIEQGVKALKQYLGSVGRYGPGSGAFLTPMYGCAELPQAFCR